MRSRIPISRWSRFLSNVNSGNGGGKQQSSLQGKEPISSAPNRDIRQKLSVEPRLSVFEWQLAKEKAKMSDEALKVIEKSRSSVYS